MIRAPLDGESQLLLASLPRLVAGVGAAQLVTVVGVAGSAPRAIGARMLCVDGRLIGGTIGGGRLEEEALGWAAASAEKPGFSGQSRRFQLGPELAQCCGGVVDLWVESIDGATAILRANALAHAQATSGELHSRAGDIEWTEVVDALQTVVIFGAGHVGTALAGALAVLPWRIIAVDDRPQWADPGRFAPRVEVERINPVALLARWGWLGQDVAKPSDERAFPAPRSARTFAVVMTHDHGIDRDLADALLQVGARTGGEELGYVGVIGSKTKIATLRRRLRDRGLTDLQLDRLVAPIGLRLDGQLIGGKLPGEIAISVAAQLLHRAEEGPVRRATP